MSTYGQLDPRTNAWAVTQLLVNAQPYQHIQNLAGQLAQPVPENTNATIIFRRYLPFVVDTTPLTEGTSNIGGVADNYQDMTYEDFQVTLNQFGSYTKLTDKVLLLHEDPLLAQALQRLGEQAGKTIETVGWNVLSAMASVILTGTATTIATVVKPFTIDDIRNVVRYLENNDAPKISEIVSSNASFNTVGIAESYFALMHPDNKKDLRNLNSVALGKMNEFWPVEQYPSSLTKMDGEVGFVEDVRFLSSTLYKPQLGAGGVVTDNSVKTTTVGSGQNADLYNIVFLGRDSYATVAVKGMFSAEINVSADIATNGDPYKTNRTLSWKIWYNVVVTNPRNCVRLVTASAR